ncbi:PaaI family thioesterase [Nocardia sp. NPDC006630]|uniref:PaaI family thioesterase n=1 Tax=Nocardia sp. NPDC006630 TaxID=3157181 RepID=UPI0033B7684D
MTTVDFTVDEKGTQLVRQSMPFAGELEIEVLSSSKEEIRSRITWTAQRCTIGGALHGGALMTLADATAAALAFMNLPEGAQGTTTIESKTNFLRSVRAGHANARSRVLHAGRRVIVVETDITADDGKPVAKVIQTQAVL